MNISGYLNKETGEIIPYTDLNDPIYQRYCEDMMDDQNAIYERSVL